MSSRLDTTPRPVLSYDGGTHQVRIYWISIRGVTVGALYHWRVKGCWSLTTPSSPHAATAPRWATRDAALAAITAWATRRPIGAAQQWGQADWPALREVGV